MTVGTKSVLFGVHCFFLHPWFVAAAWWKLYGFPWDPRLWVAFIVHDLGYVGKHNMDGPEGETHVELGARIMHGLFGRSWGDFSRYHSRFYAKRDGVRPSRLCFADKLSFGMTPTWLYLPMARWSGEIYEYMQHAQVGKYVTMHIDTTTQHKWHQSVQDYMQRWIDEHKSGAEDTWTPQTGEQK